MLECKLQRRLARWQKDFDPTEKYLMSGACGGGSTTTTTKADPWEPAQPYITRGMEDAQSIYDAQGGATGIQPYTGDRLATMPDWMSQGINDTVMQTGATSPLYQQMMLSAMTPALSGSSGASRISIGGGGGGYTGSRGGPSDFAQIAGGTNPDPTQAMNSILYGDEINPFLSDMAGDLSSRTMQTWGDMSRDVTDNLNRSVLPGLENDFAQAGGLGQSRQALLQGEATGRTMDALSREGGELSSNLAGTLANMYGTAYDADANRRASLSQFLSGQDAAERMKQADLQQSSILGDISANASRDVAGIHANASTANAAMQAQVAMAELARQQNMDAVNTAMMLPTVANFPLAQQQAMMQTYNPLLAQEQAVYDTNRQIWDETNMAPWDALNRYTGVVNPAGGMGSSSSQSVDKNGNPITGAIGGYMTGAGLASAIGASSTGFAAAPFMAAAPWLGAGLGLIGAFD